MKKIITLISCAMLAALIFTGCSDNAKTFNQKNYIAEEKVEKIKIDVRDRKIEVLKSNDNQIRIDYYDNDKEYYNISVSDNNELNMIAASNKEWSDYVGGNVDEENRKIILQVPDTVLSSLEISTTNEDISLLPFSVKDSITISNNGGNIIFDKINVGKSLDLNAKNGNVAGSIIGGYDDFSIISTTKKGESNLPKNKPNGEKSLKVSTNNGNINIELIKE